MQDVTIPALGTAMTGAVLTRWYKEPGETVAAGEGVAVGTAQALGPDDVVSGTHRSHHHALAKGLTPREVMASHG